jgi:PAS domain S-box-containing protein
VLELHVQARTQELQKLQRRYEHILNSAGEGIYGLDLQGRTTFVNPAAAKITGWKVEELIGKNEQDVFHCGQSAGNTTLLARTGEHLTDQIFSRKDGSNFPVEYVKTPIIEKDKLVGAVVIFKDITERKRTEDTLARKAAELSRSNAELEQFAYVASHDLQEPLRKIQAFGDRLKSKCDAAQMQEGRDYLERMQNAAARMQTLINDLLTFSRVISTTTPFVPVDLAVVTKEVLTDLEVRIEQGKAKVEVGALPIIDADPLQMRQLLQNLIGNALKFQPPNAQPIVRINAQVQKRSFASGETDSVDEICELTIEDNGIGFEEKYTEKIFAVFQRLHGRTEYEGTGVGLAVCRRITDRHGGTITAKSKLAEGATFTVALPVKHAVREVVA